MLQTSVTRNCSERSWRKLQNGPCGPTASFLIRNSTPIATHTAPPGNFPGEGGSSGEESTGAHTLALPRRASRVSSTAPDPVAPSQSPVPWKNASIARSTTTPTVWDLLQCWVNALATQLKHHPPALRKAVASVLGQTQPSAPFRRVNTCRIVWARVADSTGFSRKASIPRTAARSASIRGL
jgi:hypothetical protein